MEEVRSLQQQRNETSALRNAIVCSLHDLCSSTSKPKSERAIALANAFDLLELMQVYSATENGSSMDKGDELLSSGVTAGEIALNDEMPSIATIKEAYGEEAAIAWINVYAYDFKNYCNETTSGLDSQLERFGSTVVSTYYYLNICEILFFFAKLRTGAFGKFYGEVTAQKLADKLIEYVQLRNVDIERVERKRASDARMQPQHGITREEYLKRRESDPIFAQKCAEIERKLSKGKIFVKQTKRRIQRKFRRKYTNGNKRKGALLL